MQEPAYIPCQKCRTLHSRRTSHPVTIQNDDSTNKREYFCNLLCAPRCDLCNQHGILFWECCECKRHLTCLKCVYIVREQISRELPEQDIVCLDCERIWQQKRNSTIEMELSPSLIREIIHILLSYLSTLP